MSDLTINPDPRMTADLLKAKAFQTEKFCLFDVGVSGGIGDHWRIFGDQSRIFGFDPLIAECERLTSEENLPEATYIPAYVGLSDSQSKDENRQLEGSQSSDSHGQPLGPECYRRSSMWLAELSDGGRIVPDPSLFASEHVQLDQFVREQSLTSVDFIKIDTDGSDFDVLQGCESILESAGVLGFCIESQLHGTLDLGSNTFSNMSRYLESHGFYLFDLSLHRYSRSALPGKFLHTGPAQTESGQVVWGDAIYFRDPLTPGYSDYWDVDWTPTKLLKLACLFEIHGLPDCAAELILEFRAEFDQSCDSQLLLDLLTPHHFRTIRTYDQYMTMFQNSRSMFHPQAGPRDFDEDSELFSEKEANQILEEQNKVLQETIKLKDAELEANKLSIERLQNLYTQSLKDQLEG